MKSIEVRISSSLIRFQTWDIGIAISTMKKLFNATMGDVAPVMNDYTEFVYSDSISTLKSYDIGDQKLITIEFCRAK